MKSAYPWSFCRKITLGRALPLGLCFWILLLIQGICLGKYSGGSGTETDPFLIATAEDLDSIDLDPNDFYSHFKMTSDIDLSGYTGDQFNIIGDNNNPFMGVFDGNGHTISNFTYQGADYSSVGLFSVVGIWNDYNSLLIEIKNLTLLNPDVNTANNYVGALIGHCEHATVKNCTVTNCNISGAESTGGISGYNGIFINCHVTGTVNGENYVGGIAGEYGSLANCSASGNVTGQDYVGGLIGREGATIACSKVSGAITGNQYVGGLTGNSTIIYNSYSDANVNGSDKVGGLAGINEDSITNSYSTGSVNGLTNTGALVGYDNSGSYDNCFFNTDVNPSMPGIPNSADPNVTGKTTAQMQTQSTFTNAGWDFTGEYENGPSNYWAMPPATGYPVNYWQENPQSSLPTFSGGSGTEQDPYIINTVDDINMIGANPRLMNACFTMQADINLAGHSIYNIANRYYGFSGIFDGNEHSISNFINGENTALYSGLFQKVDGKDAYIRNLTMVDPNININGHHAGSLVGLNYFGTITNCHAIRPIVSGSNYAGGLIGYYFPSDPITNCSSDQAVVSGYRNAGGLIGASFLAIIENCSANETTTTGTSLDSAAGGLVGNTGGTINNCWATGQVSANGYAGGLIGSGNTEIEASFADASVNCQSAAGGLAGLLNSPSIIQDCYSLGSVDGNNYSGGIAGSSTNGSVTFRNCYSAAVTDGNNYVGAFLSYHLSGIPNSYTSCFWDSDLNPDVNGLANADDANVVGKTTAQMKAQNTFTGWDFNDIWAIRENQTYPFIRALSPEAPNNLSATAGNSTVSLDWDDNSQSDLVGYNIYRSTTSGSGYVKLNGSLLTDSNYIDSSVTNYTTYYYVVTAENTSALESPYSAEEPAMPYDNSARTFVYSYKAAKLYYSYDSGDGGWFDAKGTETGYFIVDVNNGLAIQLDADSRSLTFQLMNDSNCQTITEPIAGKDTLVLTCLNNDYSFILEGKTKHMGIAGRSIPVAKKLKGKFIHNFGSDPRYIEFGPANLKLNTAFTTQAISNYWTHTQAKQFVESYLQQNNHTELTDLTTLVSDSNYFDLAAADVNVLVYHCSEKASQYSYVGGLWQNTTNSEKYYLVIDVNSGHYTQINYNKRAKTYQVSETGTYQVIMINSSKNAKWLFLKMDDESALIVTGTAQNTKLGSQRHLIASNLKGYLTYDRGTDPRYAGCQNLNCRLDKKLSVQSAVNNWVQTQAIDGVRTYLDGKGYTEIP